MMMASEFSNVGWNAGPRRGASIYSPYTYHWFESYGPVCGAISRPTHPNLCSKSPPRDHGRVCKRCKKKRAAMVRVKAGP